jgi:septal ring factor EnvC (AmiA/AmiB activator)
LKGSTKVPDDSLELSERFFLSFSASILLDFGRLELFSSSSLLCFFLFAVDAVEVEEALEDEVDEAFEDFEGELRRPRSDVDNFLEEIVDLVSDLTELEDALEETVEEDEEEVLLLFFLDS